jgi:Leucine-rich repeat (LRR) protein
MCNDKFTMKAALKLIKKNKRTKSPTLNLTRCGLINELPPQLFECIWLENLNLGGGVWEDDHFHWVEHSFEGTDNVFKGPELERLRELPNLKEFCCTNSSIEDAGFLSGLTALRKLTLWRNKIKDLRPLENLQHLELLCIGDNPVTSLVPLAGLSKLRLLNLESGRNLDVSVLKNVPNLTHLNLSHTGAKSCASVWNLTQVRKLEMRGCYLQDADFLKGLINLYNLDLESNKIVSVDFLKEMKALYWLNLYGNEVSHFDLSYFKHPYSLSVLRLEMNPVRNLPIDLTIGSRNCVYAIRNHFNLPANPRQPVANTAAALNQSSPPKSTPPPPAEKTNWMPFIIIEIVCGLVGGILAEFKLYGFILGVLFGPAILFFLVAGFDRRRNRW